MSRHLKSEIDHLAKDLTGRREAELLSNGLRFKAAASRRFQLSGFRYALRLDVWPEDGFDNFRWDAFHRSWLGKVTSMDDVMARANAALDAYARGERPPGPAFAE